MKTYLLTVTIREGCDEYWESLKGTGCDAITKAVVDALRDVGFIDGLNTEVRLVRFEDEEMIYILSGRSSALPGTG